MTRGTTADFRISVNGDVDITACDSLYFTIKQNDLEITRSKDELSFDGKTILAELTQEETLKFSPNIIAKAQLRGKYSGKAFATNIINIVVQNVLKDGAI